MKYHRASKFCDRACKTQSEMADARDRTRQFYGSDVRRARTLRDLEPDIYSRRPADVLCLRRMEKLQSRLIKDLLSEKRDRRSTLLLQEEIQKDFLWIRDWYGAPKHDPILLSMHGVFDATDALRATGTIRDAAEFMSQALDDIRAAILALSS